MNRVLKKKMYRIFWSANEGFLEIKISPFYYLISRIKVESIIII